MRKKYHLLTSFTTPVGTHISNAEKLLGVYLKGRLNFNFHVNTLLNKARIKYDTLARFYHYPLHEQKQTAYSHECFHNISVFLLLFC